MSINLRHGRRPDGRSNLADVAALIRRVDPDIVAVQEVDRGVRRSGNVDHPVLLAELSGMYAVFSPTLDDYPGGEYGIMTLLGDPPVSGGESVSRA